MHTALAWRNIWRNPRRTAVILAAIIIGVWAMIFLGSLMRGMAGGMVKNAIDTLTGHIQIHQKGYRSDPAIEYTMTDPEPVLSDLDAILPPGSDWAGRVRVHAMANNARHSAGVAFVGIDPETEPLVSFIGPETLIEGRYLQKDDSNAILVGKALLEKFETHLGYKLVLMAQDADREVASRAFRITGVFDAEMAAAEKGFVFVNRSAAQKMLKMGRGLSEIAIVLPDREKVPATAEILKQKLPDHYEVHTWQELLSAIAGYLEIFDGFMLLWYLIIFIAMGFGIVNTILMAVFERMREFGVLKALGMRPWWIVRGVLTESCLLLLLGMAAGNLLSLGSIFLLSHAGGIDLSAFAAGIEYSGVSRIVLPVLNRQDLVTANLVVFFLGLLISLYPAIKAARFTPVQAMTHI